MRRIFCADLPRFSHDARERSRSVLVGHHEGPWAINRSKWATIALHHSYSTLQNSAQLAELPTQMILRGEHKSDGSHFFINFASHKRAAVGGSNHSEGVTCEYDRSGGAKVQRTLPPSLHPAYPRRAISNGFNSGCRHRFYPSSQKLHHHCDILFVCGKLTPFVMGQSSRERSQPVTVKTCECLVAKVWNDH